jgi:hypothetical protein
MRTMLKAKWAVDAGNKAIKEGSIGRILEATTADIKPEATYFYAEDGKRTALFIFDLKSPTDIPRVCERLFMGLNADIELTPMMTLEDLKQGLSKLG